MKQLGQKFLTAWLSLIGPISHLVCIPTEQELDGKEREDCLEMDSAEAPHRRLVPSLPSAVHRELTLASIQDLVASKGNHFCLRP